VSVLDRIKSYRRLRRPENWLEQAMVDRGAVLTDDAVLITPGGSRTGDETMKDLSLKELLADKGE